MFVGGDRELLQEVAQMFLKDCPRLVQNVKEAIAGGDAKKLWMNAHTLKGTISHFGAKAAGALADQLQTLGRKGGTAGAAELAAAFEHELERVLPTLRSGRLDRSRTGHRSHNVR